MSETELTLGTHCGITFAGIKAASLFSLKCNCLGCLKKYEEYFYNKGFSFLTLKEENDRVLILVYNRKQLKDILFDSRNYSFLQGEGYSYQTVEEALAILKCKMQAQTFPHEIGIFLNYPLEDVKGFISHPNDGVKLIGCWKVYADEEKKRRIFETYERCTKRIKQRLISGVSLENIFCKTVAYNT